MNLQEKNLIQFAFWTGLRTSELIALRWQDVDLETKLHPRPDS
jgi:integrase